MITEIVELAREIGIPSGDSEIDAFLARLTGDESSYGLDWSEEDLLSLQRWCDRNMGRGSVVARGYLGVWPEVALAQRQTVGHIPDLGSIFRHAAMKNQRTAVVECGERGFKVASSRILNRLRAVIVQCPHPEERSDDQAWKIFFENCSTHSEVFFQPYTGHVRCYGNRDELIAAARRNGEQLQRDGWHVFAAYSRHREHSFPHTAISPDGRQIFSFFHEPLCSYDHVAGLVETWQHILQPIDRPHETERGLIAELAACESELTSRTNRMRDDIRSNSETINLDSQRLQQLIRTNRTLEMEVESLSSNATDAAIEEFQRAHNLIPSLLSMRAVQDARIDGMKYHITLNPYRMRFVNPRLPDVVIEIPQAMITVDRSRSTIGSGGHNAGIRLLPAPGTTAVSTSEGNMLHPHVRYDGIICWGDEAPVAMADAWGRKDWESIVRFVIGWYTRYNYASPYFGREYFEQYCQVTEEPSGWITTPSESGSPQSATPNSISTPDTQSPTRSEDSEESDSEANTPMDEPMTLTLNGDLINMGTVVEAGAFQYMEEEMAGPEPDSTPLVVTADTHVPQVAMGGMVSQNYVQDVLENAFPRGAVQALRAETVEVSPRRSRFDRLRSREGRTSS